MLLLLLNCLLDNFYYKRGHFELFIGKNWMRYCCGYGVVSETLLPLLPSVVWVLVAKLIEMSNLIAVLSVHGASTTFLIFFFNSFLKSVNCFCNNSGKSRQEAVWGAKKQHKHFKSRRPSANARLSQGGGLFSHVKKHFKNFVKVETCVVVESSTWAALSRKYTAACWTVSVASSSATD